MYDYRELIYSGDFETLEKKLIYKLKSEPCNVDVLMMLALTELKYPMCDEIKCIEYLNRILEITPNCFSANIIKLYCMEHLYVEIDRTCLERLSSSKKLNATERAIVYYINSWEYSALHKKCNLLYEQYYLMKSIELYPCMVNVNKSIGCIMEKYEKKEVAKKYYSYALKNVRKVITKQCKYNPITAQSFIDEYITGFVMSEINYENLKRLAYD